MAESISSSQNADTGSSPEVLDEDNSGGSSGSKDVQELLEPQGKKDRNKVVAAGWNDGFLSASIGDETLSYRDISEGRDGELYVKGQKADKFALENDIVLRPNTFLAGLNEKTEKKKWGQLSRLEHEYNVNIINEPVSARTSEDKKSTKQRWKLNNLRVPETYSFEEARHRVAAGQSLIAKPQNDTCCGDGVELIENIEDLASYVSDVKSVESLDETLFEDYLPIYGENSLPERRAFYVHKDGETKILDITDRERKVKDEQQRIEEEGLSSVFEPQNIANGGRYSRPEGHTLREIVDAERAVRSNIDSKGSQTAIGALDYVLGPDGAPVFLEDNRTPGLKLDKYSPADITGEIEFFIEEDDDYDFSIPDHIADNIVDSGSLKDISIGQASDIVSYVQEGYIDSDLADTVEEGLEDVVNSYRAMQRKNGADSYSPEEKPYTEDSYGSEPDKTNSGAQISAR